MARAIAIKPEEEFARSYADRLILEKLSEMESAVRLGELAERLSGEGIGLATVRALLASNPARFTYHERRWIPSARLEGQGRPIAEVVAMFLHSLAGPATLGLLTEEIARVRNQDREEVEKLVLGLIESDSTFVQLGQDRVALTEWGFVARDEPLDRALALNGVSREDYEAASKKVEKFDFRTPESIREAVKAAAPISLKVIGAAAYAKLNSDDPRSILMYDTPSFVAAALSTPDHVLAPDGTIYPQIETKKWLTSAVKVADKLAPLVEVDDAAPIEVKADDTDKLVNKVLGGEQSVTATKLLEEFYEITPGNKTFPDDMANVMTALNADKRVQWVGGDRFRKTGEVPEYIQEVPEPFYFPESGVLDEEGEPVDVELTDEGLSTTLRKLLQHPLAMDVLDEDIQPAPKTMPETVRLVLKSIHRELGTFPLCQLPTAWLDAEPNIQELIVIDPAGRELQVWVNQEARLMYNWIDWWYEQPIESGAVFTLTKTPRPNVLEFAWMDQPDPVVYISSQRMEELREIGIEGEGKSTLDLLIQVFSHWPKGADYLTLLAEVNVVRRSSRRLIASLLSSYQCFYQRSGSPVWHFDAKKVEQGFDKTKRKFVKK